MPITMCKHKTAHDENRADVLYTQIDRIVDSREEKKKKKKKKKERNIRDEFL